MTTEPAAPAAPPMSRRSWYSPADVAERLASVVDAIYWETRRPKHEIIGAAFAVAVEHQAEILARVKDGSR